MAVLWDLVASRNLDPFGSGMRGYQAGRGVANERATQGTLAQLASGQLSEDDAARQLLGTNPQVGSTLAQLGMRREDQQFRRETRAEDTAWRQQQAEQARRQWEATHGLQRQNAEFQRNMATRPDIQMVEQPDGSKVPVLIDRMTGEVRPLGGARIGGQPQGVDPAIPPPPPGVDAKKWREKHTEALVGRQNAMPTAIAKAEGTIGIIDDILNDPYLPLGTGFGSLVNVVPGTPGYDFQQKVDQLKGRAFLEAFESLKGGGQISNIEGQKAEQAIARLSTGQRGPAFKKALQDLREVAQKGIERARQGAGAQTPQQQQQRLRFNPATGDFE